MAIPVSGLSWFQSTTYLKWPGHWVCQPGFWEACQTARNTPSHLTRSSTAKQWCCRETSGSRETMYTPFASSCRKTLGLQRHHWHVPAFGEEVGMGRSHEKKQAKSEHHKGAVGQLIAIDPWGNGTCVLIAKSSDLQDPELVHGLQPKTIASECLRLSQPRLVPDGWNQDALQQFASRWQTIRTPEGKDLWLGTDTGQTQYASPFIAEVKPDWDSSVPAEEPIAYWGEATDPANAVVRPEVVVFQPPVDQPVQVRDSLTKTVPKARIIPNRVVMSTTGAQYDVSYTEGAAGFPQDCLEGNNTRIAFTILRQ